MHSSIRTQGVTERDFADWVNQKIGKNRLSALHVASFYGNLYAVRRLISAGARADVTSRSGLTPLHLAAQGNQPLPVVFFVQEKRFDVHVCDKEGNTALHWACKFGATAAVNFLTKWFSAADINAGNSKGVTPLHFAVDSAVSTGSTATIKILLFSGAIRDVRDRTGRTPADYLLCAEEENRGSPAVWADIARVLREPTDCACLMLRRPIKRMRPSRSLIYLYTCVQTMNLVLSALLTIPRRQHR